MADALNDFGPIDEMKPEAVGLPGSRRFRLLFKQGHRTACFWMEKQQLGALADAVNELLGQAEGGRGKEDLPVTGVFAEPFEVEAQTGRLALGYNETSDLFLIFLYDIENELNLLETAQNEEEVVDSQLVPLIRVEVSRTQLERFYSEAAAVINAGRPQKPSKNGHIPYQTQ